MTHHTFVVANALIEIAGEEGKKITPLQLQKLTYIAHGWNLAIYDEPLLNESVRAWKYGPVIPSLYQEFKRFGDNPIDEAAQVLIDDILFPAPLPTDSDTNALLKKIWEVYGGLTAYQLSNLTHQSGTPWDKVSRKGTHINKEIPDNVIRNHYLKKVPT